ncbi:PP2C family protein-serine/threonine phosphatase [Streptomyces qinglanensis]|uniref:Serine phosphatase RsbU, regulator of sigma subunit n=1 Tax=Streptomyces qinglanensis TaxID=943816 RepID=A0A1H9WB87_9ACTN|nr:SpoIIE family protein phosphatase [Streptomyces qinglanensis]SES31216.1 Serine phosphatase RsbU, regulator of sigma subunit [Streptomyces qinglanensis]
MAPSLHADRSAPQPPDRGTLDALITQARTLRGRLDAVRRGADEEGEPDPGVAGADPGTRWRRALCELAVHQLDDLGSQLDQLREGMPPETPRAWPSADQPPGEAAADTGGAAYSAARPSGESAAPARRDRVGSAEWNLLTDEVSWSPELYGIFGRTGRDGPLSLDELPSWVVPEDQPALALAFTDCLVDGRAIDQEFRLVRPDGSVGTVHMVGEPVLDSDGSTASMWAVVRDVSALRRSEHAVRETRDSLQQERHLARTEHKLAVELQEAVLPPWRGSLRFPQGDERTTGALDLAAHYLPSASSTLIGGDWYDAMELPGGATLLTAGDLTGHGVTATSGMAMLLGAVRGMALAGVGPGALMGHLNQLLDSTAQPSLGSALCCRYEPHARTLTWAQAGHPAPLLFRDGAGSVLPRPEGVLLGVTSGAAYGQRTVQLRPGDLLVLHTDGLAPDDALRPSGPACGPRSAALHAGSARLLALADRFTAADSAQECVRAVAEAFADREREDDACVLVARVTS